MLEAGDKWISLESQWVLVYGTPCGPFPFHFFSALRLPARLNQSRSFPRLELFSFYSKGKLFILPPLKKTSVFGTSKRLGKLGTKYLTGPNSNSSLYRYSFTLNGREKEERY